MAGQRFSQGTPVSSINKADRHSIAGILLKVALNAITITLYMKCFWKEFMVINSTNINETNNHLSS
jgi:hypothetical protein